MKTIKGTLRNIQITHSEFGQQYWTIDNKTYAMWEDYKRWPKPGDDVEIELIPDYIIHYGNSQIKLGNCAKLIIKS